MENGRFLPGRKLGRPLGSRNKLEKDLLKNFAAHSGVGKTFGMRYVAGWRGRATEGGSRKMQSIHALFLFHEQPPTFEM
jgi:hypothetical protein